MKEIQEIKNDIMLLKNLGNIPEEVELVLLRKLNTIEKQLMLGGVVGQSKQCCEPLPKDSFYLGTTCPECNKPFRNI